MTLVEKLMMMRQEAKMGLKTMEDMGQMGNSEEATIPDDMPFDINDIDMDDEEEYNSEDMDMAQGGVVYAANGFAGQAPKGGYSYKAPTIPKADRKLKFKDLLDYLLGFNESDEDKSEQELMKAAREAS